MEIVDEGEQSPKPKRGRPKADVTWIRVSHHMPGALIAKIDAYRHARGLRSRADTIRKLLEHSLGGR